MAVLSTNLEFTHSKSLVEVVEITLVERKLEEIAHNAQGVIQDSCANLINAGGKRVRPMLTLLSAMCFGSIKNETILAAVAAELIHMASLIHDDIIDNSLSRRGKPTVQALHGNKVAVLTGDYLFAEAFRILSASKLQASMGFLVTAIKEMCDGEVNQAADLFVQTADPEIYFSRIAQKTGMLLSACCQSGAAVAGAAKEQIESLRVYGLYLGQAYQIMDDIMDFIGNPADIGKPIGQDFLSGNLTLPVIYLLQDSQYHTWVQELIARRKVKKGSFKTLVQALVQSGSLHRAYRLAVDSIKRAQESLATIPEGHAKKALLWLAEQVIQTNQLQIELRESAGKENSAFAEL